MKKILFVGTEALPFAATGGLGDVLGSLPTALKARYGTRADIRVAIPLYRSIGKTYRDEMKTEAIFTVPLSWRKQYCAVRSLVREGVVFYFVENDYYFARKSLYGEYDDGERFAYFSTAVLEMLPAIGFFPDIFHANDWQTALSVILLKIRFQKRKEYRKIRTVFTIHNIEYQGKYDFCILGDVFGLDAEHHDLLDFDGCINLMKGAVECADRVTTVSPRYAAEICRGEGSHGLHPILTRCADKLSGILNGIDNVYYDPETDREIPCRYSASDFSPKKENKYALQRKLGLPEGDVPLFALIARLVPHKGLDLIRGIAERFLSENDVEFVLLGTGEPTYEEYFRSLEKEYPERFRALILYDRSVSKQVYAAADFFLMPSLCEPCGLSQMIASRYGAVPIVRETGGLYDSIKSYWDRNGKITGNGFTFWDNSPDALYDAILSALKIYGTEKFDRLREGVMTADFSWGESARAYQCLYQELSDK